MHTTEFLENCSSLDSVVWCTLRSLTPQWDAYSGAWLHGVQLTTGCSSLRTPRYVAHCGLRGMLLTAESDSVVGSTPRSFLKIWISRQNRTHIQKYFSLVRIMKKKLEVQPATHSFKASYLTERAKSEERKSKRVKSERAKEWKCWLWLMTIFVVATP